MMHTLLWLPLLAQAQSAHPNCRRRWSRLMLPARIPLVVPGGSTSGSIQPVIVHAQVGGEGNVEEIELSAASDPALMQRALDAVKNMKGLAQPHQQQQLYVQVRFLPAS
jgi:hypothetical protein